MMSDYYILDGHDVIPADDVFAWGRFFDTSDRAVAKTSLKQKNRLMFWLGLRPDYRVSTVFLGIDHNFSNSGPPLVFETMVFPQWPRWINKIYKKESLYLEEDMDRYSTWEEAMAGHLAMTKKWSKGCFVYNAP